MPTPKSEPYGIVVNSKGVPFFTQLMGNRIGSIDPVSMTLREYFLGCGHRAAPARDHVRRYDLFTDYARGRLGRLDPRTGQTKEWTSPSGALAQPYAITRRQRRLVCRRQLQSEHARAVRPSTERFQTWAIPSGGGVVRHMVVAPDGSLWLACSEVDTLAKVDIKALQGTR